jgi:hypothetical protein
MSQIFQKLHPSVLPSSTTQAISQHPSAATTAVNRLKMLKQPTSLSALPADTLQLHQSKPTPSVSFGRDFSQHRQNNTNGQSNGISPLRVIAKTGMVMAATVLGGLVGGPWLALGAGLLFATTLLYSSLNPGKKAQVQNHTGWPEHHTPYREQTEPTNAMHLTHVAQSVPTSSAATHPVTSQPNPKMSVAPLPHWAKEGIPTSQLTNPVAYVVLDRHQGTATLVMQKPGEAEPLVIKRHVNFLQEPATNEPISASTYPPATHEATAFHPFQTPHRHNQG